jgi:hypothetical protein
MENEYLSDDEKVDIEEEKELTFEEMYPEEEMDEETLNLIYNNNNIVEIDFNDYNKNPNKKKDKKKDKIKVNDIISLKDLSDKFEKKKIEKWSSKRTEGKRNESKKEENKKEPRYKFNPRLPPFNSIIKEYNNEKNNSINMDKNNFPSL